MLTEFDHYLFQFHDQFVEVIAAGIHFENHPTRPAGKRLAEPRAGTGFRLAARGTVDREWDRVSSAYNGRRNLESRCCIDTV